MRQASRSLFVLHSAYHSPRLGRRWHGSVVGDRSPPSQWRRGRRGTRTLRRVQGQGDVSIALASPLARNDWPDCPCIYACCPHHRTLLQAHARTSGLPKGSNGAQAPTYRRGVRYVSGVELEDSPALDDRASEHTHEQQHSALSENTPKSTHAPPHIPLHINNASTPHAPCTRDEPTPPPRRSPTSPPPRSRTPDTCARRRRSSSAG